MRRGILATRDELKLLGDRVNTRPFDTIYDALRRRCSLILETAPMREAQWRALWHQGKWGSAVTAARGAQGRIFDLLVAHHIESNLAYRSRAIEELVSLIGWSTWSDPCYQNCEVDLCTAEAGVGAIIALDWLWEDITQVKRDEIISKVRESVITPYIKSVESGAWWYNCYHHWNAVVNAGCGLAALALSDTDPDAAKAYRMSRKGLKTFLNTLGKEGGWDEGTGLWGYSFRYILLLAEAATRLEDDQSIYHSRGVDQTGLFAINFTPNGQSASFGDMPTVPLHGAFYLLSKRLGCEQVCWWLDAYSFRRDESAMGWSKAALAMLFRPDVKTVDEPKMDPLKVFNQIGWASMVDRWPKPAMYASIKTGDMSANQSHHDMNSIQLQVDGEMLLVDPVSPSDVADSISTKRDEFKHIHARSHNTMIVAEEDHRIDARGRILDAEYSDNHRWILCDSGQACGEIAQFRRHVIMTVDNSDSSSKANANTKNPAAKMGDGDSNDKKLEIGNGLLVLDEVNLSSPEKVELFWHSRGQITLDEAALAGKITGSRSSINFALASTNNISVEKSVREVNHHVESSICISSGVIGKAYFASLFTIEPQKKGISITTGENGSLIVQAGQTLFEFVNDRNQLKLLRISKL